MYTCCTAYSSAHCTAQCVAHLKHISSKGKNTCQSAPTSPVVLSLFIKLLDLTPQKIDKRYFAWITNVLSIPMRNVRLVSLHSGLKKVFLKHISCSPLNTVRVSKHRAKHFYLTFIWKISFAKNGKLCDDKLENNFSKINKSRLQQVYFFWCASTRGTYISRLSDGKGWQDKIRDVSRTAKQPKAHLWPWDAGGPSIPIIVSPLSHLSHKKTSYQTLRAK